MTARHKTLTKVTNLISVIEKIQAEIIWRHFSSIKLPKKSK